MTEEPNVLMLEMLRRVRERMEPLRGDVTTQPTAPRTVEVPVPQEMPPHSALIATLNGRMARFDERLERIERRLGLAAA